MSVVNRRITSFFRPSTKQTTNTAKRTLPEETSTEHARRRSKSPRISKENSSPLPIRTDSPNAKRVASPLAAVQHHRIRPLSSELSELSALTPSDSEAEDTIVVQVPYKSPKRTLFRRSSSASAINQSFASSISSSSHRIERFGETIVTGSDDDDSDELLDLDELLNRKPLGSRSVQQIRKQRQSTRKTSGTQPRAKYVDTSKQDEAKFKMLMEQTRKDIIKYEDSTEALKLANRLETQLSEPMEHNTAVRNLTTQDIISRVQGLDPEQAEKFAQAMDRIELTHTSQKWSFFDADMLEPSTDHRGNLRRKTSTEKVEPSQQTSSINSPCRNCGRKMSKAQDGTNIISCCECEVWQHQSCFGVSKAEVKREDFVFICKACKTLKNSSNSSHSAKEIRSKYTNVPWPEIRDHSEWSIYQDSSLRELAFIGGVFEQAAADRQLPDELYIWILRQSFHESQQNLRQAYQSVLKYAKKSISSNQAFTVLQASLKELGASEEAITSSLPIKMLPADPSHIVAMPVPQDLMKAWLQNAGHLARFMSSPDRARLLEILLMLTLDSAVPSSASILADLQHSLASCIKCFEDTDADNTAIIEPFQKLFHRSGDAHCQLQCLNILPSTTRKLSKLRRRLALAAFYEDSSYIEHDAAPTLLEDIRQYLSTDKQFQMTSKTDYRKVAALIACLDIAIGDGDVPESTDSILTKQFNTTVDRLAQTIQVKLARIQATGAAHISRTETKDTLESVERRLIYTVRTKQKQRRDIYEQPTLDGIFQKQ